MGRFTVTANKNIHKLSKVKNKIYLGTNYGNLDILLGDGIGELQLQYLSKYGSNWSERSVRAALGHCKQNVVSTIYRVFLSFSSGEHRFLYHNCLQE